MAIKVIVELQAKPGQRAVLKSLAESVAATLGPGELGFLGSTRYEVLDNPAILVEIAEWASADDSMMHLDLAYCPCLRTCLSSWLPMPEQQTHLRVDQTQAESCQEPGKQRRARGLRAGRVKLQQAGEDQRHTRPTRKCARAKHPNPKDDHAQKVEDDR